MNYTKTQRLLVKYDCGCQVKETTRSPQPPELIPTVTISTLIEYCPIHKAAPDMYEALKALVRWLDFATLAKCLPDDINLNCHKALAKAEGK